MSVLDALRMETPRPRMVREHRHAGWLAVATVCAGAFIGQLDVGAVAFTFPALEHDFHAPLAAVEWASLSYLVALVVLAVAAGRLADSAGRKLVYLYGFMVFTIGSAGCGLAPTLGALITFRVIQAVGAAMLQANGVALVMTSVPQGKIRAAIGVQGVAQALGLAAGPAAGGLLTTSAGWRWIFLVNVPIGCAGVLASRYLLPRTPDRTAARRFDYAGLVLLAAFTSTLLLAISCASGLTMPSGASAALAVTCVLSAGFFWLRIRHSRHPLVDPSPLTRRPVMAGLAGALCGYLLLFAPLMLFPQVYAAHAMHGAAAGALLTMLPAGFALTVLTVGKTALTRWTSRVRGVAGGVICVPAFAGLALTAPSTAASGLLLTALGMGLGVFVHANNSALSDAISVRLSATGGGLVRMTQGLGCALGIAAVTLCLHRAGRGPQNVTGLRLALAVLAATALIAIGTALVAGPRRSPPAIAEAGDGVAPDARFVFANERTFLAWIRTALALVAAGLAIVQLLHPFPGIPWGRHLLGGAFIVLGAVVSTIGYREWRRNQRALLHGEPLPRSVLPRILAVTITATAIASAVVLTLSAVRGH
ncbi:MAG: transporter [Actinoallomurus sp.]|nr:transporter [Actinoallomurus sp.]